MSGKNLSFLSKKSWHTGTIRHMDKVWRAEQKHESEQKKIKELQQELARERAKKELLDAKKGSSSNEGKESLGWMYRGVLSSTTTEQELNKPYIAPDDKEDLSTPSLFQKKTINATQDDWNKVMEDPLLEIKQKENDALKMITKNPLKMKEILKKLQEQEAASKKKKSHKKRKRSSIRELSRSPPRKRKRSISPDVQKTKYYEKYNRNDHHRYEMEEKYQRTDRNYRYSRRDRYDKYDRHEREDKYQKHDRYDRRTSPTSYNEDRKSNLQSRSSKDDNRYRNRKNRTSSLSEAERKARIADMENTGKANYEMKLNRYIKSRNEKNQDEEPLQVRNEDENFISKIKQGVYMSNETTIEERLGRNKHYLKRDD